MKAVVRQVCELLYLCHLGIHPNGFISFADVGMSFVIIVELSGKIRRQHVLAHYGTRVIFCTMKMKMKIQRTWQSQIQRSILTTNIFYRNIPSLKSFPQIFSEWKIFNSIYINMLCKVSNGLWQKKKKSIKWLLLAQKVFPSLDYCKERKENMTVWKKNPHYSWQRECAHDDYDEDTRMNKCVL